FGGSPVDLKPLTDALEKGDHAFRSIILPGHGTTPKDLKDVTVDEWLKESFSAYKELKKEYNEVSVVGFSMGGAIALFIAAEKDVNKLVLISPYFKVKEKWFYFGKPEKWANRLTKIIPFVKKPKIGQINDPDGLKRYVAYKSLPTKSIGELSKIGSIATDKGKSVTCETLWIHSKGDIVADFQLSKEVYKSIPSKKKYFIEYNKSNHIILYDYDYKDA
ncbi:alpha/beta hydrolase, partial [Candidatus Latescibacterota bacterium]